MCGIAGVFLSHGEAQEPQLHRAIETLAHRGPDEKGFYCKGALGMGQSRLSIIDLEGGHQPLLSHDGGLVLVANGEIYNFVELRKNLEKRGHRFLTRSDSEAIIHCYAEYGDRFLEYLNGMFAFALYDKAKNRLILARDRLGIKPLFLHQGPRGTCFSSEIKALLPLLNRKPGINPHGLAQYLQNQFSSGGVTIFEGVERILPGEAVCVENGETFKRWRYWSALEIQPRDISQGEAQSEFDALMETVMIQHMRSDVPFGLFLSGGVDSAILLALLSDYKGEPIRTFSVGFPGTTLVNELPGAGKMARLFSSRHTEIIPSERDIFHVLPLTVWAADDLMRDYANLPTALLSRLAGDELKVVFSGEGGDEVFAGYGRYRARPSERFVKNLLNPGSGGFRVRGDLRGRWPEKLLGKLLLDAARSTRLPFVESWSETPSSWSALQKMQYVDIRTALPDNLLVKADRMMMAFGLEGRVPFLDHRVVEFGLSLPDRLKVERGGGKLFLKKWASAFLPEEHLITRKKGFHVPVREWFSEDFLQALRKTLPHIHGMRQWFQPEGILELTEKGKRSSVEGRVLWSLIQFAIWHKIFIEGSGERPPDFISPIEFLNAGR